MYIFLLFSAHSRTHWMQWFLFWTLENYLILSMEAAANHNNVSWKISSEMMLIIRLMPRKEVQNLFFSTLEERKSQILKSKMSFLVSWRTTRVPRSSSVRISKRWCYLDTKEWRRWIKKKNSDPILGGGKKPQNLEHAI